MLAYPELLVYAQILAHMSMPVHTSMPAHTSMPVHTSMRLCACATFLESRRMTDSDPFFLEISIFCRKSGSKDHMFMKFAAANSCGLLGFTYI